MNLPILLISAPVSAERVADTLRRELDAEVLAAPQRRAALALLRRQSVSLVLLDESLAQADDVGVDLLYQNAGAAPLLEINFAVSSGLRVLRQARAALARRGADLQYARKAALQELHSTLNGSLTGLLLESQLLLRSASAGDATRLRHLVEIADGMRDQLRH